MNKNYVITTDSPLMGLLGLSSFTLDELEKWVSVDKMNNRQYMFFHEPEGDDYGAMKEILYGIFSGNDIPKYDFDFTNYRQYGMEETFKNVISEFDGNTWTYQLKNLDYNNDNLDLTDSDINPDTDIEYTDDKITRLIELNDLINNLDTGEDVTDARKKFLRDVKTSREGGVQWSSNISFRMDKDTLCPTEVIFKIKLYDQGTSKPDEFALAIPDITLVGVRQNELGVSYTGRDAEDRLIPVLDDEPTSKVGGKLDTSYNEYTKKFESGTTNMIAVMVTDLAAVPNPEAGAVSTPDDYIQANANGFQPTYGRARPINMKGNNFRKWGPEWKYTAGCSEEEKQKVFDIPVQNKLNTAFSSGERVMLSKIGGVWQPIASKESDIAGIPVSTSVSNWHFTYAVSNVNYFFRDTVGTRFTYTTYEKEFLRHYYNTDVLDNGAVVDRISYTSDGYVQLTSWDFMGKSVGGLRDSHALCNTQFIKRADGTDSENTDGDFSTTTAPFFGCVFPDGYNTGANFNSYSGGISEEMQAWAPLGYLNNILEGQIIFDPNEGDNVDGGIFQNITDGDSTVHQLPADIATNSTPSHSGVGGAITILQSIDQYLNGLNVPSVQFQENINNYLSLDNDKRYGWISTISDSGNSTFEFTPINPKNIQFRPLKVEVLAILDLDSVADKTSDDSLRKSFGTKAWNKVSSTESPISTTVKTRVLTGRQTYGMLDTNGFKFANDLHDSVFLSSTSSAYPFEYWNQDWQEQSGNPRPAGAFGIIGASCTVTCNTSISFSNQCNFGMDSTFTQGGIFGGNWYSSYGGDNNTYYSRNNSALHVRIYQAWPKELTIYDPRFFAIHHFNPGANTSVLQETVNADDSEIGYPDHKYQTYIKKYALSDFRIPTKIGTVSEHLLGVVATVDDIVYGDIEGAAELRKWRDKVDWQIDITSRGKLLPCTITRLTIGINEVARDPDNTGKDYVVGNTFTVNTSFGTDFVARVSEIGTGGEILDLEITDKGKNFDNTGFFDGVDTPSYKDSKIKLNPVDVNGEGAKLYAVYGIVYEITETCTKPELATAESDFKLSTTPPIPDSDSEAIERAINEVKNSVATISNHSDSKQYDLFFHFYNDVSHCFMDSWGFSPTTREQQMNLEITPV